MNLWRQLRIWLIVTFCISLTSTLSGCGKLSHIFPQGVAKKAALTIMIPVPAPSAVGAQSFMDKLTLTTAVVTIKQGATELVKSVGITGNSAQVWFEDILPGSWQITATLKDEKNYNVFSGTQTASVSATESTVTVSLTPVPGTVDVAVHKPDAMNVISGDATLVSSRGQNTTRSLAAGETSLTTSFSNVTPAIMPLKVRLLGSGSVVLAAGEQPVNVMPGRVTTAHVAVTTNGSLAISTSLDLPPSAPKGVTAAYNRTTKQVTVNWLAVDSAGLVGYNIFRSESATGAKLKINNSLITNTNYIDTNVSVEKSYYYWIQAVSASDLTSDYSAAAFTTTWKSQIAFTSKRDGNPEIYVMNADGSDPVRITYSSTEDDHPMWSPDGSKIAFYSERSSNNQIWTVNPDGSGLLSLRYCAPDSSATWSPDGKLLLLAGSYYTAYSSGAALITVPANGGEDDLLDWQNYVTQLSWSHVDNRVAYDKVVSSSRDIFISSYYSSSNPYLGSTQQITDFPGNDEHPRISPNGQKIVFSSERDGNQEIYMMNIDGSQPKRLTDTPAADFDPAWSPDGTKIVFVSRRDGNAEIYLMDVADPTKITRITNNTVDDYSPDWTAGMP